MWDSQTMGDHELRRKIKQCEDKFSQLQEDNMMLSIENTLLEGKIDQLEEKNALFEAKVEQLEARIEMMALDLERLRAMQLMN